jgi:hypothetical protein
MKRATGSVLECGPNSYKEAVSPALNGLEREAVPVVRAQVCYSSIRTLYHRHQGTSHRWRTLSQSVTLTR